MLTELSAASRVVGVKQVKRAVESGRAQKVFLAQDAEARVAEPIAALCGEKGLPVLTGFSMRDLGRACGISVGAAVAALVKD